MRFVLLLLAIASLLSAEPHRILFLQIAPYKTGLFVSNADGSNERPLLAASSRRELANDAADAVWVQRNSK